MFSVHDKKKKETSRPYSQIELTNEIHNSKVMYMVYIWNCRPVLVTLEPNVHLLQIVRNL